MCTGVCFFWSSVASTNPIAPEKTQQSPPKKQPHCQPWNSPWHSSRQWGKQKDKPWSPPPPKTNMTMEKNHLKMYYRPLKMVIFLPVMLVFRGVFSKRSSSHLSGRTWQVAASTSEHRFVRVWQHCCMQVWQGGWVGRHIRGGAYGGWYWTQLVLVEIGALFFIPWHFQMEENNKNDIDTSDGYYLVLHQMPKNPDYPWFQRRCGLTTHERV